MAAAASTPSASGPCWRNRHEKSRIPETPAPNGEPSFSAADSESGACGSAPERGSGRSRDATRYHPRVLQIVPAAGRDHVTRVQGYLTCGYAPLLSQFCDDVLRINRGPTNLCDATHVDSLSNAPFGAPLLYMVTTQPEQMVFFHKPHVEVPLHNGHLPLAQR